MKKLTLLMAIATTLAGCGDQSLPVVDYPALDTTNPLLAEWDTKHGTPPFDKIELKHYEPAFKAGIEHSRAELKAIVENPAKPTFGNTIEALERQGALLGKVGGVFYPLTSAATSDEMEQISMNIQPLMTELSNDISLNPELFERVKAVYNGKNLLLSAEQKLLLETTYKSFARRGAALSDEDKELYRSYTSELGQLTLKFGQNALAATNDFAINIRNAAEVAELPEFFKASLAAEAKARGERGWTVTLKAPSYIPFMTYSSNRAIKERLYRAYNSRALGGKYDNGETIRRIAELRLNIANILGYATYADYALDNRMADDVPSVNNFLTELLDATKDAAIADYNTVAEYAKANGLRGELMPWDFGYYSEKYKNETYSVSDEAVKPYFELDSAINGVFLLANKLFGINFEQVDDIATYHEEVTTYEVTDKNGKFLSVLYLDFHPRDSKRSGAWMTGFRDASRFNGVETRPLVSLVMNFTKATESTPALLTYDEFETFLHEFGHGLHGMLAKGDYESQTGTSVYRDFVELPSQLLENWAYEKEYLDMWAKHYQTGEQMPQELIANVSAAQKYNAAYGNVRQVQFGLLDMAWHSITEPYTGDIESFEQAATERTQITPVVSGVAMSPAFTHIFSGGYSAGYYSYKWAEVLEADAFAYFKQKGLFDEKTANSLRKNILERGGQEHPMDLYVKFRGAKPQTKALIDKILD